jgi:tripartite-type tricarboxylate transporter receptor subunit TctC
MRGGKLLVATIISVLAPLAPALADSVADFYGGAGREMKMVIRSEPGSGYDQLSRLLARHIARNIPGNPNIVPVNMPGGGGITAANYLANVAPKDGSVVSIVGQGLVADQALGLSPQLKADVNRFNWIGNLQSSNQILIVWHTSPTKSLEDAKKRETSIGTTGAGSASTHYPAFYNQVLGTKFKLIFGYTGGPTINMAMERGEVEGRGTNTYASYLATTPHFIERKLIRPLIQIGIRKDPNMPDVPLLIEQDIAPENRAAVAFMSKAATMGRPFATTPGVLVDRVSALRRAFDATMKDPAFVAEAEKLKEEIDPMKGEELAQLVHEILEAGPAVRQRVLELIKADGPAQ